MSKTTSPSKSDRIEKVAFATRRRWKPPFDILRALMDAATITRPIATKDDSMAVAASRVDPFSVEPPPGERIAAKPTKTTPVQIVLMVLGTIAFLYFARPRGPARFPGLCGGNDPETAHPMVVLLPHSAGALRRGRALFPGGRRRGWFLSIGPPGVDVDE
jgi:hypothetical protein